MKYIIKNHITTNRDGYNVYEYLIHDINWNRCARLEMTTKDASIFAGDNALKGASFMDLLNATK